MTYKEYQIIHEFVQAMADSGRGCRNPDTGKVDALISFDRINDLDRRIYLMVDEGETEGEGNEADGGEVDNKG